MRIVLILIIGLHGIIHLTGFLKAFAIYDFEEFTNNISKTSGILWLLSAIIFILALIFYAAEINYWWLISLVAVTISQILIIYFWKDAKFGTIANIIILVVSFIGYQTWKFENRYKNDYSRGIDRTENIQKEILTEEDIRHLPALVQEYIKYVGAVNKPKVLNVKVNFEAGMRSKTQDWFQLTAEQHNFFDTYERFFFLKAKVKGLPTNGYHIYKNGNSSMTIKLLSIIPVVHVSGREMYESETVTLLNDMCFLAPATLIDKRIKWEKINNSSVRAVFTNNETTVSAVLYFNDKGQLLNFESFDRYDVNVMKKYKFSTPLKNYQTINGYNLAGYGEAIWHYPEGEFVYGRYHLKNIRYNVPGN